MKTVKTLLMTFCLALAGCGMTDPWEQYEHQGDFTDRLLPSDTEKALCAAYGWKMTYQNTDFYFRFSEDGTVVFNSNMFEEETSATYHLDWDDPMEVKVIMAGGGHLSYLSNNEFGETLIVTSVSDNELKCRPESSETEYTMTAITESDVQAMEAGKTELQDILVAAGGWSIVSGDDTFYFLFADNGIVACLSNAYPVSNTSYIFSGNTNYPVVTMEGLQYFDDSSFAVEYDPANTSEITFTGTVSGTELTVKAAGDEVAAVVEESKAAIVNAFISHNYQHGVVRASNGTFLAHYVMNCAEEEGVNSFVDIKFDVLYNRVLTHKTVAVSDVDIYGNITFAEPISINGTEVSSFVYNLTTNAITANNGNMNITANNDVVDWFINDFKTYVIIPNDGRGDMEESLMNEFRTAISQNWYKWEISDRDRRPFICTPSNFDDSKYYTGFYGSSENKPTDIISDEIDKIKFPIYEGGMPLGGDSKNIATVEGLFPNVLDAYFHEDGLYVILEGEKNADNSQLYLISPTTDKWFKADRDM